jgi:GNAT superfamily N-acetyltransferase
VELAKRLPRYPSVPVARLGRLAVDQAYRGRKLGAALLILDAKDEQAEAFYLHHGFVPFGNRPRLVLPVATFQGPGR